MALTAALTTGLPAAVHADATGGPRDPVLARLGRIARGDWTGTRVAAASALASIRPRSARAIPYGAEIRAAARRYHIPASLLAALVRAESGFDRYAISHLGARGLGQLMPATAAELSVADAFDPEQNLDGSARYLARQLRRFGSYRLALTAYHAGPARAARGFDRAPAVTRAYVERVLRFERDYRRDHRP